MEPNEAIVNSKVREDCFRLLSACFYEPQKQLLLDEELFEDLTKSLKHLCPSAVVYAEDMEKSIHNSTEDELRIDYAKLFVGPFELRAPPYGSVYLEEGRRVMGDTTMEVIGTYETEGLAKSESFQDLPDHIAVELEFMSYLFYKEREALEKSDAETARMFAEKQDVFLNNYLRPWISPFCEKMKEGSENGFYKALAACLDTFVLDRKQ